MFLVSFVKIWIGGRIALPCLETGVGSVSSPWYGARSTTQRRWWTCTQSLLALLHVWTPRWYHWFSGDWWPTLSVPPLLMIAMFGVRFSIHVIISISFSICISVSLRCVHQVQKCDPLYYWPLQTEDELELVNEVNLLHVIFVYSSAWLDGHSKHPHHSLAQC